MLWQLHLCICSICILFIVWIWKKNLSVCLYSLWEWRTKIVRLSFSATLLQDILMSKDPLFLKMDAYLHKKVICNFCCNFYRCLYHMFCKRAYLALPHTLSSFESCLLFTVDVNIIWQLFDVWLHKDNPLWDSMTFWLGYSFIHCHYAVDVCLQLTRRFTDKPTRGESGHRLVNSQTSQLADSKFFLNHRNIIIYLYAK